MQSVAISEIEDLALRVPDLFNKEYIGGYIGPMPRMHPFATHGNAELYRYYSGRGPLLSPDGYHNATPDGNANLLLVSKTMLGLDPIYPRYGVLKTGVEVDAEIIVPYDKFTTIADIDEALQKDAKGYERFKDSIYRRYYGEQRIPLAGDVVGYTNWRKSARRNVGRSEKAIAVSNEGSTNPRPDSTRLVLRPMIIRGKRQDPTVVL